jgi:hypothetical protein
MFDHIRRFPWVLDGAFEYENSHKNRIPDLLNNQERRFRSLVHYSFSAGRKDERTVHKLEVS